MRTWWLVLLVPLVPCVQADFPKLEVKKLEGQYSKVEELKFNTTTEYVVVFPTSNSSYPYRIKAWSKQAVVDCPVLMVVKQEREVLSWQIPFLVATSTDQMVHFRNTSRTLCHNNMNSIARNSMTQMKLMLSNNNETDSKLVMLNMTQNFIVSVSTSSSINVDLSFVVEEETDFYLTDGMNMTIKVSPSQPTYYYYKFSSSPKFSTAMIHISSEDDVCLVVSIQDSYCPVFDLNKDITYEGKYQTINRKGGMSIRKRDFPDGFFLVFVAKGDNYDCSQEHSALPRDIKSRIVAANRTSIVHFTVNNGIDGNDYGRASLIVLGAIGGFYVVAIIMIFAFTRWGTISKFINQPRDEIDSAPFSEDVTDEPNTTQAFRTELIQREALTVDLLAKAPSKDIRRAYNYLWHIMSIAIFYSIPVVQLVITYQRVVNSTGDQDMCYYNFLCANPALGISDFNHIYSNIGYVLMGVLFLGAVMHRNLKIRKSTTGIPIHYGVFYAMGIALIIEGLLSACYHVCPTQSNYQFDTSFMYVMAVLCMVKLYQNRHPDINATAYATFTVLGFTIFLAMFGILNGSLTIWIVFVIFYSILCAYISFKIYYISFVWSGIQQFRHSFSSTESKVRAVTPIKRGRFIFLILANLVNYAMLITGLFLYKAEVTDFGTFLLAVLMGNSVLHSIFYTGMKLINGERICFETIIYGLLSIAVWALSSVFFLDNATLWTVTPAESRKWNQECILMDFYDTHDIWHLLSAPALYLTFMYLLTLDDDLIDKKRNEITVF